MFPSTKSPFFILRSHMNPIHSIFSNQYNSTNQRHRFHYSLVVTHTSFHCSDVPKVSKALRAEFAKGDGRIKRKEDDRRKKHQAVRNPVCGQLPWGDHQARISSNALRAYRWIGKDWNEEELCICPVILCWGCHSCWRGYWRRQDRPERYHRRICSQSNFIN